MMCSRHGVGARVWPWMALLFAASLGTVQCSSLTSDQPNGNAGTTRLVIVRDASPATLQSWPTDPFVIDVVAVTGDVLTVMVHYAGGCRPHDFTLVIPAAFLESHPVQSNALLAHDAHDDACEAIISRSLVFDLSPLKAAFQQAYQQTTGTIRLNVATTPDWSGSAVSRVTYTF